MRRLALALAALALVACGSTDTSEPGDSEGTSNSSSGKADIYGTDSRFEAWESEAPLAGVRVKPATAMLFSSAAIAAVDDASYTLSNQTMGEKYAADLGGPVCSTERFREQVAPGYCSGFLIAPDLVATAGHCVNFSVPCHRMFFTFDFTGSSSGDPNLRLAKDDVYRCQTVVGHDYDRGEQSLAEFAELWQDWAVVKLDRPVRGVEPMRLSADAVAEGQRVIAVGHPLGLPMKITPGEVVDAQRSLYFNTDLDIYRGNSGSVVVDDDSEVVGIVSRGTGGKSFSRTSDGCFASNVCEEVEGAGCTGNHVIRSGPLAPFTASDLSITAKSNVILNGALSSNERTFDIRIDDAREVSFVTVNLNGFHQQPTDLDISLEHDGQVVEVLHRPSIWPAGSFRMSRTTMGFEGANSEGVWRLRVRDARGPDAKGNLEWWQVVIGSGSGEPAPRLPFVGAPCESDADCGFQASGAEGFCHTFDANRPGYCSIPCEGFCPDSSGWATTFCIGSEVDGMGVCAAKAEPLNNQCADIPGTAPTERDRFIGTSSASRASAIVCDFAQ